MIAYTTIVAVTKSKRDIYTFLSSHIIRSRATALKIYKLAKTKHFIYRSDITNQNARLNISNNVFRIRYLV